MILDKDNKKEFIQSEDWGVYSKLVIKELERLNDNYEGMRDTFTIKFQEISNTLSDFKSTERAVKEQKVWIEKVNDIWSPTQMKEAKDELYRQKSKWGATIAIITFVQILLGIAIAVWGKF
jgi:hypothetical protein